jgi:hypothetical protein
VLRGLNNNSSSSSSNNCQRQLPRQLLAGLTAGTLIMMHCRMAASAQQRNKVGHQNHPGAKCVKHAGMWLAHMHLYS